MAMVLPMVSSSTPQRKSLNLDPSLRQDLRLMRAMLRNPLDSLPPETFTAPMVRSKALGRDVVHVMAPELVQAALTGAAEHLDKGDAVRRPLGAALGEGLLTAEGDDWRWQRRAIAPVFRANGLERFLPAMITSAEATRDRLLALPPDSVVTINHEMMRLTFDIIVETMLSGTEGFDASEVEAEVTEYLRLTRWSSLAALAGAPEWAPYPGKRRSAALAGTLRRRVEARVARRRAEGTTRNDLIDLLLRAADPQTGRRMTDAEIGDNLLTFLTAGHETTALGLAWTLDLLGRHPEITARVRTEIAQVTQGASLTSMHISALHYTRQVFQEALRLYPPASIIPRRVNHRFELGGDVLTPGTLLLVPIYAIHRHEALWDAPHVFDPERFQPEQAASRHRYAYMPFGAGPRICIGSGFAMLEAVAILAVLLRDLNFIGINPQPPAPCLNITLRPMQPLTMKLAPALLH